MAPLVKLKQAAIPIAYILLTYLYAGYTGQQNFSSILCIVIPLFLLMLLFYRLYDQSKLNILLLTGFIARLILIFDFPSLSDDIYRFFWDGHLVMNGHNPYAQLPSVLILEGDVTQSLHHAYEFMNSKNYYSVYPPITQFFFLVAVIISSSNIILFSIVLSSLFVLIEFSLVYLLFQLFEEFQIPKSNMVFWLLNPFVLIEFVGNLHFDLILVFFLILSLLLAIKKRMLLSGLMIGFGLGIKPQILIFAPFLFLFGTSRASKLHFVFASGLSGLLIYLPLLLTQFQGFSESIDLYFRRFEFNASIYNIARWIGIYLKGFNPIAQVGPFLSFLALISILYLWTRLLLKKPVIGGVHIIQSSFWAFAVYLLGSTTVHPWYLLPTLALSLLIHQRWFLIWTITIFFSYIHYDDTFSSSIQTMVMALGYIVPFIFCWVENWTLKSLDKMQ
jgi:hypothetical protein